jgi:hypothetical protein
MIVNDIVKIKNLYTSTDRNVVGDLVQDFDRGKDFIEGNNNYTWFWAIGHYYKPKKIVEQGTRFGYSLKAFVSGAGHAPSEYSISVYDMECDGFKPLTVMEDYFINKLNIKNLTVHRVNTQSINDLGVTDVDLAMVDGEHTESGCLHECQTAWAALRHGGVMVVDDAHDEGPKAGTMRFCALHGVSPVYLPSFRGIYLIEKK